jgi:bacterioferritin
MQGKPEVTRLLNELLSLELTAVHQYLLHSRMLEDWGYERLHHKVADEVNDELGHAGELMERILFLEGAPDAQTLGTVQRGANVEELFRHDLDVERTAAQALNRGIAECRQAGDEGTSELLEKLLQATEEHLHWLESQLELIGQVGLQNYLAEQLKNGS